VKLQSLKTTSEYQDHKGNWVHADGTRIGYKRGYYDYSWKDEKTTNFNLKTLQQSELAVYTPIKFEKTPVYDRVRRAHKSLPSPLKIRITFIDVNNVKTEIMVDFVNIPPVLVTKEEREKKENAKTAFYVQCDDADQEFRIMCDVFNNEPEGRVEAHMMKYNYSKYLYPSSFRECAFKAKKENKDEVLLEEKTEKMMSAKMFGVVDRKNMRTYALKFELTTGTSSSIEYFLLPKITPKKK